MIVLIVIGYIALIIAAIAVMIEAKDQQTWCNYDEKRKESDGDRTEKRKRSH